MVQFSEVKMFTPKCSNVTKVTLCDKYSEVMRENVFDDIRFCRSGPRVGNILKSVINWRVMAKVRE